MSETFVSLLRARADVHPPVRAGVRPAVPGHGRAAAAGAQSQHRPARRAADRVVRAVDRADPAQARRRVPRADHRAAGRALPALPGADPVDGDRAVRPGRRAGAVARGVRDRPSQPAEHPAGGGPALPVSHRLPGAALAGPGLGREAGPAAVPARHEPAARDRGGAADPARGRGGPEVRRAGPRQPAVLPQGGERDGRAALRPAVQPRAGDRPPRSRRRRRTGRR